MQEVIKALIEEVRTNSQIYQFDEAATKQAIILRLLNILGWNVLTLMKSNLNIQWQEKG